MVAKDIITHEVTHGVNDKLIPIYQSGALAESLSDIMAAGLDGNWTMGEGSLLGIIRYMDDPTKSSRPQPDRLFSELYLCSDEAEDTNDYGYIHTNMGVINKMFYLMVEGGNFNNCSVGGIGRDKALKIIYRYMTVYMTPTENFRNTYNSVLQSCSDLYQANSQTCVDVTKALRSVEIDQQPADSQKGAKCLGLARQTPNCVIDLSGTPSLTTTTVPTTTGSPTAIPTVTPTITCNTSGNVSVNLKLKFQGILKQPDESLNNLRVAVTAMSSSEKKYESCGNFVAGASGIWSGKVYFNIPQDSLAEKFKLFVKGPKHLQKKVCQVNPGESLPDTYQCLEGKIELNAGGNELDFSKITLLAGDLPEQDGLINSYDIAAVVNSLGKKDSQSLKKADINLDGVVNTQDYSLIIAALSIRLDEQ